MHVEHLSWGFVIDKANSRWFYGSMAAQDPSTV
jgi:hypothetical protein